MRRNCALNLLVADAVTGAAMRALFARDLTTATRVDPAGWQRRPAGQPAAEKAANLLAPNL